MDFVWFSHYSPLRREPRLANTDPMALPKVLVTQLEMLKPGVSGVPHMKTESAFVQAMTAAKRGTHYLGMDLMSGASRVLFLVGYDSFAAWE